MLQEGPWALWGPHLAPWNLSVLTVPLTRPALELRVVRRLNGQGCTSFVGPHPEQEPEEACMEEAPGPVCEAGLGQGPPGAPDPGTYDGAGVDVVRLAAAVFCLEHDSGVVICE